MAVCLIYWVAAITGFFKKIHEYFAKAKKSGRNIEVTMGKAGLYY